jgi:hypothetical protein
MERLQKVVQTWVDDETGKTREEVHEFDERGARVQEGADSRTASHGELPADLPSRDVFMGAGYGTIEALRQFRRRGPFTRIEGIDSLAAQAAEQLLAVTPEDDSAVAQATSADARSSGVNTSVAGGAGTEATGPIPPAKDIAPASPDTPAAQADASLNVGGEQTPVAGHGVEGFIVGDKDNPGGSHVTTDLSLADGATKTKPIGEGAELTGGEEARSAERDLADGDSKAGTSEPDMSLRGKLPDDFPHRQELVDAG